MEEAASQSQTNPKMSKNFRHYWPQLFSAVAASVGGFGMGSTIAYSSSAIPSLVNSEEFSNLTESSESWIASLMPLASIIAGPTVGISIDQFGRKSTMMVLGVPFLCGWLLISFARNLAMIYCGRALTGFCAGAYSLVSPIFISENTETSIRGTLGSLCQLMVTIGIFYSYVVGAFVPWNTLALTSSFVPILLVVLLYFVPESPRYLIGKGKRNAGEKSLSWLRNSTSITGQIEAEIVEIETNLTESKLTSSNLSIKSLLLTPSISRPTLIVLGVMFFQQGSGIDAVIFYTVEIFQEAGQSLDPNVSTIIIGAVQVVAFFISGLLVDRIGRKPLLLISGCIMAVSLFGLGLYFQLSRSSGSLGWLPLTSLILFCIAFSIGFGPIPWILMGEILPNYIIGLVSGISICFNWTLVFLVTKFFGNLKEVLGLSWCYWMFSIISLVGVAFVILFVPETKGKSLEEIQKTYFNDSKSINRCSNNSIEKFNTKL